MLIDLISQNNYKTYNVKLANILGLTTAVYISELLSISKDNIIPNLNAIDITSSTGLSAEQQKEAKSILASMNLITEDPNKVILNVDNIVALFATDSDKAMAKAKKAASKVAATAGKLTTRQKQCNDLKSKIICSNDELFEAYTYWIDGVYANPKGFLSARSISIFQKTVDDFAKGDLDLALKIIDIATVNGYRDATWAINLFNRDYAAEFRRQQAALSAMDNSQQQPSERKVDLGSEVF